MGRNKGLAVAGGLSIFIASCANPTPIDQETIQSPYGELFVQKRYEPSCSGNVDDPNMQTICEQIYLVRNALSGRCDGPAPNIVTVKGLPPLIGGMYYEGEILIPERTFRYPIILAHELVHAYCGHGGFQADGSEVFPLYDLGISLTFRSDSSSATFECSTSVGINPVIRLENDDPENSLSEFRPLILPMSELTTEAVTILIKYGSTAEPISEAKKGGIYSDYPSYIDRIYQSLQVMYDVRGIEWNMSEKEFLEVLVDHVGDEGNFPQFVRDIMEASTYDPAFTVEEIVILEADIYHRMVQRIVEVLAGLQDQKNDHGGGTSQVGPDLYYSMTIQEMLYGLRDPILAEWIRDNYGKVLFDVGFKLFVSGALKDPYDIALGDVDPGGLFETMFG